MLYLVSRLSSVPRHVVRKLTDKRTYSRKPFHRKVMAQKFIGRWTTDLSSMKGFGDVMDAYGIKEDMRAKFCENKSYMDIQIEGDVWTVKAGVEGVGEENYTYKLGEVIQVTGLDGSEEKGTSRLVDGVLEERFRPASGRDIEAVTTRTINGNVMTVKTVVGGATSTMNMLKG